MIIILAVERKNSKNSLFISFLYRHSFFILNECLTDRIYLSVNRRYFGQFDFPIYIKFYITLFPAMILKNKILLFWKVS
jgi:hypothetical protein